MKTTLSVLTSAGDESLSWDPSKPEDLANVKVVVFALKALGYEFFLQDGSPADDPADGQGELQYRRVGTEELLAPAELEPPAKEETHTNVTVMSDGNVMLEDALQKRRRGRPPKVVAVPEPVEAKAKRGPYKTKQAVAVPRMRGG
jgi:hypothetical protein